MFLMYIYLFNLYTVLISMLMKKDLTNIFSEMSKIRLIL